MNIQTFIKTNIKTNRSGVLNSESFIWIKHVLAALFNEIKKCLFAVTVESSDSSKSWG